LVDHVAVVGGYGCDAKTGVVFVDAKVAFGKENDFVAGDVVLFQGLCDDPLRVAVRVDVCLLQVVNRSKLIG
jgi:hypothetical protein